METHKKFKLNGISFSHEELMEVGYSLVKEGEDYEKPMGDFLLDWCNTSSTIAVQTSGSTGNPKTISLKKEHMVNSAIATGEYFQLKPSDTALLCLPVHFIAGKMMLVRAMVLGLQLDYVAPTSIPLDFISKSYDFCAMVPLQAQNSLRKLDLIGTLIVGGASISRHLIDQLQKSTCRVFETYGMTETITHVALKNINTIKSSTVETNFKTLPNILLSLDNRDCLVINAPEIADGPIITNDMVKLISKTEFKILGRHDNVINSGGIKLNPEHIESKLAAIIKGRFFVAGFPDTTLGQKLVLLIEGKQNIEVIQNEINSLKSLEKFETPKTIFSIPSFLETATGKVQRKETAKLLAAMKQ